MLESEVISAVAIGNLKAISEQPAMLSNLAYSNIVSNTNLGQQNAVANQQSVGELGISVLAKGSNTVANLGPMDARAAVEVLTNNELAQTVADLKGTLEAFASGGGHAGGGGMLGKLKALIDQGLRVDQHGVLVVPARTTVLFAGSYRNEDVKVTLENHGVLVKVSPR